MIMHIRNKYITKLSTNNIEDNYGLTQPIGWVGLAKPLGLEEVNLIRGLR